MDLSLNRRRWMRNLGKIVDWAPDGKPLRILGVTSCATGTCEGTRFCASRRTAPPPSGGYRFV